MKIKTKTVSLFLALLLLFMCIPLSSCDDDEEEEPPAKEEEFTGSIADTTPSQDDDTTDTAYSLPEGDESNKIRISSYEELMKNIAQKGTFILDNDIEIPEDFTPIGNYAYPFLGTFDGDGKKITFKVKQTELGSGFSPTYKFVYCGLFGVIEDSASIKNLTVDITCDAEATTSYCFVLAGGIVGYMSGGEISNCTVNGEIKAKSEFFNSYCGGVAGIMQGGTIENCTVNANLNAHDSQNRATAGGIVAYAFDGASVSGCTANGNVTAISTSGLALSGGLAGNTMCASFTACGAFGDVYSEVLKYKASDSAHGVAYGGGLVGLASGINVQKRSTFVRCYAALENVTVIGNNNHAYAAGIAANVSCAKFEHCYSLCDVNLKAGLNRCYVATAFYIHPANESISECIVIKGCFSSGNLKGTYSNRLLIYVGTSYYTLETEGNWLLKENLYYNKDASFEFNNQAYKNIDSTNGKATASENLSNLEFCCDNLGWNSDEWENINGVFIAK